MAVIPSEEANVIVMSCVVSSSRMWDITQTSVKSLSPKCQGSSKGRIINVNKNVNGLGKSLSYFVRARSSTDIH